MVRRLTAGLVVAGLAIGVWLLWPDGDVAASSTTTADATPTTVPATPTSAAPPAITPDPSTTSTTEGSHVVDSVEEAEAILRELWFGWFEGIYNQDEDRIRQVVATDEQLSRGTELFKSLEFTAEPTLDGIRFSQLQILRADRECTALWADADASAFRGPSATGSGVWVLRRVEGDWKLTSLWASQDDLWEADCEAVLSPLSP